MNKTKKLILCICLDAIGYLSYVFPLIDIIWAPLSGVIMWHLFKGKKGKVGALVSFIEEALPVIDFIPTFSIMWLYDYFHYKKKHSYE